MSSRKAFVFLTTWHSNALHLYGLGFAFARLNPTAQGCPVSDPLYGPLSDTFTCRFSSSFARRRNASPFSLICSRMRLQVSQQECTHCVFTHELQRYSSDFWFRRMDWATAKHLEYESFCEVWLQFHQCHSLDFEL